MPRNKKKSSKSKAMSVVGTPCYISPEAEFGNFEIFSNSHFLHFGVHSEAPEVFKNHFSLALARKIKEMMQSILP